MELWRKRHELAGGHLLHVSAYHGIKTGTQLLLEEDCDPNAVDDFETAMHWAACGGNEEVVWLLLEKVATVIVINADGFGSYCIVQSMALA